MSHLSVSGTYTALECKAHCLVIAADQLPNGDAVIESALKCKGAIFYICAEVKEKMNEVSSEIVLVLVFPDVRIIM